MRYTKIAMASPFSGAPKINFSSVFGASPNKPFILRIPVTGQRPITYGAENLPEGLSLKDNIITGAVLHAGDYEITLTAENVLGKTEKKVKLEIYPENVLVTPLLGFTTWNAFGADVTQEDVENTAQKLVDLGITEYGYRYFNLDSGWQEKYGGEFDAVMPNKKFPDMKKMTDKIHALGCKAGLSVKPGTPVQEVFPYLDKLDLVLVMSVEPGFGGQSFMPSALPKLTALKEEAARRGLTEMLIQVDGGVGRKTAQLCADAGANVLVAGSAVFGAADPAAEVEWLRGL